MVVLVAGGSQYSNKAKLWAILGAIHQESPIAGITHGDSASLARLIREWAELHDVLVDCWAADWNARGPLAGPDRNTAMLEGLRPDVVISLPGSGDLTGKAIDAGLTVLLVEDEIVR